MTKQLKSRWESKTPKVIKFLQKLSTTIGLILSGVTPILQNAVPELGLPKYTMLAIMLATVVNAAFLQMFTEEDNK